MQIGQDLKSEVSVWLNDRQKETALLEGDSVQLHNCVDFGVDSDKKVKKSHILKLGSADQSVTITDNLWSKFDCLCLEKEL